MSEEKRISVSDMLRLTGKNTGEFMTQVAEHLDKLVGHIVTLEARIAELESKQNESN